MTGLLSHASRFGLAAALLVAGGSMAPAQQRVGVNSAVNPEATGTPPGGNTRRLVIGQDVVFNEHITTSEGGQTQLLFLDQSSMTVGPNSDLTIDQFVYDPRSDTGKLAMSATRGVLRYIGGKLSKQDGAVTLRTSTATLAVRGGAFIVKIDRNGRTETIFIFGDGLTVTGLNGISRTVSRPGFKITVAGPGAAPSQPAPVSAAELAQLTQQLDGRSGGSGGASVIPTDTTVAASGISQTVSGDISGSIQQSAQNQSFGAAVAYDTAAANPTAVQTSLNQLNSSGQVITCTAAGTCPGDNTVVVANTASGEQIGGTGGITPTPIPTPTPTPTPTPIPAPTPTPTPTPVTVTYTGQFKDATGNGTAPLISYSGTFTPQDSTFRAENVGSLGNISIPLSAGNSTTIQGTSSSLGTLTGTAALSADETFFYANLAPISDPSQRLFIFGGTPVNAGFYQPTGSTRLFAFTVQPDAALKSIMPFVRNESGGSLPGASVSPFYIVAPPTTAIGDASTNAGARGLQVSLAINGQGANQQSAIAVTAGAIGSQGNGQPVFNGQMRGSSLLSFNGTPVLLSSGVSSTVDGSGNSFYGGDAISGFVLQPTGTASETPISGSSTSYGFAQPALPAAVPSGVGATRTTQTLSGSFGGLMYTTAQPNPYIVAGGTVISTDAQTNRVQATLSGGPLSPSSGLGALTLQFGGLEGTPGGQAFIDDSNFAAMESPVNAQQVVVNAASNQIGAQLYLVSSGAAGAPTSLLPPGASYCQCQYLQWGYWGGDLSTPVADPNSPRIDSAHINTWVAGVPTPLNDMSSLISQSATATYAGHAIGSVFNNGASYVAAGGFTGSYNFGSQSATMAVNNFDGRSFVASGSAPLNGASYSFSTSSTPGVQGSINGTFYGPMAAETGGNFAFQTTAGPTYMASGIFAGKR